MSFNSLEIRSPALEDGESLEERERRRSERGEEEREEEERVGKRERRGKKLNTQTVTL